jgi:anti-sigma regulatory factor (Ser/Thr protein kinase)
VSAGTRCWRAKSDLSALPGLRAEVEQWLGSYLDQSGRWWFTLAFAEAFVNCVEHAYEGRGGNDIEIRLTHHGDEVEICLRDWGKEAVLPTDYGKEPGDQDDLDGIREGGRGVLLMKKAATELTFTREEDSNVCRMVRRIEGGSS